MEKLKQESVNLTEQNIDRIAELFPSAITETKDADGNLKKAINFTILKQLLSGDVVDGDECYEFTWVGKKQSIIEGNKSVRKTLRPAKDESKNWDTTENLYIEGDNLEVLKLLQNSYSGSIKMISIDPPYNTGNDFVYRDNFAVSKEDYDDGMGVFDENENRLFKNTETNGRFHSDWCSMMYPRLQLARNLLADNGVILIHIDDNEVENLKHLCNEIFGASNQIGTLIWNKQHSQQQGIFKRYHEFVLVYAKNISVIKNIQGGDGFIDAGALKKISKANPASDFNFPAGVRFEAPNNTILTGTFGESEKVTVVTGKMVAKNGRLAEPVTLRAGWTQKNQMSAFFSGKDVIDSKGQKVIEFYFNSTGKLKSRKERSSITPSSILPLYGMVSEQSEKLKQLLGGNYFDNPKPINMISDFLKWFLTNDDIVLDFFSGSATTAHAVIQLNAEDGGNRKFIMVQLPEETDENSEAYKSGYKNICEIGKERIRRAGKKIEEELQSKSDKGGLFAEQEDVITVDTGFRVLKLDSTNMKDVYYSAGDYSQQMLLDLESNIKEDRTVLDLLFGVMLDWGVPLSLPHITEIIGGKQVHFVNDTDLVACFDENINEAVVREIAKRKPLRVVFRDSSFGSSPEKINVSEIFKTISPDTTIKVI